MPLTLSYPALLFFCCLFMGSFASQAQSSPATMETYALRLKPGQDLKTEIHRFAKEHHLSAGFVLTCVGSLRQVNLRYANQQSGTQTTGFHEILSLSGTFSEEALHLHLSVADSSGKATGGHLLDGNLVYTTAELVLGNLPEQQFLRTTDPTTGFKELDIRLKP
jgi:predicted DNA-binding protein with PD1-like motif